MPNINLLPWREERRKELKQEFFVILGAVSLIGVVCVGFAWLMMNLSIDNQRDRNGFLQKHIADLELQVKEIKHLKQRRAELLERMKIIQNLQGNRPVITRVFSELVTSLPDGVFFTKLALSGKKLSIIGTAESNNRVSSLMRKLDQSEWFENPNLTQVKANPGYGEQASDFTMSVKLVLPGTEDDDANTSKKKTAKSNKKKKSRG
jgi:type IV pilus assembly protein PilN